MLIHPESQGAKNRQQELYRGELNNRVEVSSEIQKTDERFFTWEISKINLNLDHQN